jgi:hypothetical protein
MVTIGAVFDFIMLDDGADFSFDCDDNGTMTFLDVSDLVGAGIDG